VVAGGGGGQGGRLPLHSRQLRDRSPTHIGGDIVSCVEDQECLCRILDLNFPIPDPGSTNNFSIFNPKIVAEISLI
jgi:hypothetical protein